MAFYNIAGLDWSEVAMVGWFGVNCKSSETDQRLKWGGGHDHGEGELRAIWKEGRWELEESKMLCRIDHGSHSCITHSVYLIEGYLVDICGLIDSFFVLAIRILWKPLWSMYYT